jgi:outer membrane protein
MRATIASPILLSCLLFGQVAPAQIRRNPDLALYPASNGAHQQTGPDASPQPGTPGKPPLLTRQEAERIAIANNPRIRVSDLVAKIQTEVVRETRSAELPAVSGDLTAVDANQGSRISSGTLNSSRLLQHAGVGVEFRQLITDFGRTRNLVTSERLREKAREADLVATRQDIVLATDQAFYQALQAQATVQVAKQTVDARQALVEQVSALTTSKLKSDLDLSFAQVSLAQAKLLLLNAQNDLNAAYAALASVLGYDHSLNYQLVEDSGDLPSLPSDLDQVVNEALQKRPDLQSLQYSQQAAQKFSVAQRDQLLPTIEAVGVTGYTPWGSNQYFTTNWYGAVGLNISVPIFNGFRFNAQAAEATLQANAQAERARDLRNQIVRGVRTAWLTANTDLQRVAVTAELLKQANLGLNLAKSRYDLGLSSIVELSQAQLQQTQAAIDNANAKAQFGLAYSDLQFQIGSVP